MAVIAIVSFKCMNHQKKSLTPCCFSSSHCSQLSREFLICIAIPWLHQVPRIMATTLSATSSFTWEILTFVMF